MSVLAFAEIAGGKVKKSALEVVSYASSLAAAAGTNCTAIVLGPADAESVASLGSYGASKVLHADDARLEQFSSKAYAKVISQAADAEGANLVLLSQSSTGKALAGRVAIRMNAGLVSAVSGAVESWSGQAAELKLSKPVFSGKASAVVTPNGEKAVVTLNANSVPPQEQGSPVAAEAMATELADSDFDVEVVNREAQSGGRAPLPEAELVVSAGRGLKGPENWGMVEDLAEELGATTACSRPVADTGWRPHHEHVGQTGVAIKPNLYIAIGISGAIQHLAGVNQSKTIVVINKDPEAPFFKAADYGVVGDAFDVVPRLVEAVKKFNNS
jgi:electron transfer flavoprotein alpha subunit